jgi:hypothetical protein
MPAEIWKSICQCRCIFDASGCSLIPKIGRASRWHSDLCNEQGEGGEVEGQRMESENKMLNQTADYREGKLKS